MKLKIETPMASAPMAAAESSPQCPAMAVETIPMSGTVMFETMFGSAMRSISRFMFIYGCKDKAKEAILWLCEAFICKWGLWMYGNPEKWITFAGDKPTVRAATFRRCGGFLRSASGTDCPRTDGFN